MNKTDVLTVYHATYPQMSFMFSFFILDNSFTEINSFTKINSFLEIIVTFQDVENTAKVLKYVFLIFPQFSLGMGLIELVTNQFQYQLLARFGEDTYVSPYEMDMLGLKFAVLAAQGLVFFIITCIVHSRKERALRY